MTTALNNNQLIIDTESFASGTISPSQTTAPGATYRWRLKGPGFFAIAAGAGLVKINIGGTTYAIGAAADTVGQAQSFNIPAGWQVDGAANGAVTITGGGGTTVLVGYIGCEKVPV